MKPVTAFSDLPLSQDLLAVVDEMGFSSLTPIQAETLPVLLQGRDLIGQSKTGSGKTLAFALPILQNLVPDERDIQALVLCPTRELCMQVARELRKLGRRVPGLQVLILSGGQPGRDQAEALRAGAQIIVGTPGRVLDFIDRGLLDLSLLRTLVLDEADRMLDMGFEEDMSLIMDEAPSTRQTVFFSATYPDTIGELSARYQHDPIRVTIEREPEAVPAIEQVAYLVEDDMKTEALLKTLQSRKPEATIVFCNLKAIVAQLAERLADEGVSCSALHGDLEQVDREHVMAQFRNGSIRVLVATDVAARGLDVESLPLVVNYDVPNQLEDYVHRIGRTGRAGRSGVAVSFVNTRDLLKLDKLGALTGTKLEPKTLEPRQPHEFSRQSVVHIAKMQTLRIAGGRKDKVRPGDLLGALTGEAGGLQGSDIGKIEIFDRYSLVAVSRSLAPVAAQRLRRGQIKGRKFTVNLLA